jgi:O-antigen ligase
MDTEYATRLFYPGLIGFGLFIALAARMFRMALEIVREARAPLDAPLANAYLSILIAVALFSTLSASLSPSRAGAFIFIVAGMLAALHRSRIRPERRPA